MSLFEFPDKVSWRIFVEKDREGTKQDKVILKTTIPGFIFILQSLNEPGHMPLAT